MNHYSKFHWSSLVSSVLMVLGEYCVKCPWLNDCSLSYSISLGCAGLCAIQTYFCLPNLIAEIELEQDTIVFFNRGFHCRRWIRVNLVIRTCFRGQMWMNSSSDDTFPLIFGRFVLSRNYMEIKSKNFIIVFLIIWLNLWLMTMIGRSKVFVSFVWMNKLAIQYFAHLSWCLFCRKVTVSLRYADLISILPSGVSVMTWPIHQSSNVSAVAMPMNCKGNGSQGNKTIPARLSYAEEALRTKSLPEGSFWNS